MKKSPGIAVILSILLAGAGSMYCERVGKGIAYLIFTVIGYCCLIIPGIILHIRSIVAAYNDAKKAG
jgi:TM2 domain-containing membrane protein YozV